METQTTAPSSGIPTAPVDEPPTRRWAWRRLLLVSGALMLLLMIASMAFTGPDPIFIVMAVLVLAGLVLTRWKMRLGALVILLPSLAILAFGVPQVIFVVANPIAVADVSGGVLFVLAVLAAINVLAIIATLGEGFLSPLRSPRGSVVVAVLAAVLVVAVAVLGAAARLGFTNASAISGDTRLEMKDFKFSSESLDSNQTANVYLTNSDPTAHTFTIDGAVNRTVPANSNARVTVNLRPGQYHYYCAVPGHSQTMHGTLTVH
jgi:plastocyanin